MRTERDKNQPREIRITPNYTRYALGSVLVETGETKVICTASLEESVPGFLRGQGKGWVTAEYSMLPGATHSRVRRERSKVGGRTMEIQRLIGRSLRSVVDFSLMGERMITLDCDVIQADGGTRTASITGAYVALAIALGKLQKDGTLPANPLSDQVAAISLGKVDSELLLDLDYDEDSQAEVDMNLVMTASKGIIEIQGTAERAPFSFDELNGLAELGWQGLEAHFAAQKKAIEEGLA